MSTFTASSRVDRWRELLFPTPLGAVLSALSLAFAAWMAWHITRWLLIEAVAPWEPARLCSAAAGACWPFWREKLRFILFGTYPFDAQWRPALVSIFLVGLTMLCGLTIAGTIRIRPRMLAVSWIWVIAASFMLMGGGFAGLAAVDTTRWNGLPLLLMLSVIAIVLAFPLGILLALARYQDRFGLLRRVATAYIEFMRGVPMVTALFVGVFVLPLMLPRSIEVNAFGAVMAALVAFNAAYFAEDVRGGLLSLPKGQVEAASALGLRFAQSARLVLLPQALQRALPALLNSIIGAYKDTSLVVVLGFHDLNATARMAFADVVWGRQALEAYTVVAVWFLLSCAFLSWVGRRLSAARSVAVH